MKKLIALMVIGALLTACNTKDRTTDLINDGKKSYDTITKEAGEVVDKVNETKEKIEETVEDIDNAIDAMEDAKTAIKEIAE